MGHEAILWACTSGSFGYGFQGAQRETDQLAAIGGNAGSEHVADLCGCARRAWMAVATSYPHEVATLFIKYLAAAGVDVTANQVTI